MLSTFLIHLILFSCIPIYFARQDSSIRSTSYFCYLSVLLILANYLSSIYSIPVFDGVSISGGTLFYCAFMMSTVLFVIIEKDASVIRVVIRLVISVNLFLMVLSMIVSGALRHPDVLNPFNTSANVFNVSIVITSVGGILTISELLLLVFLFEWIKARVKNILAVSLLYIAMFIFTICLDGFLFPIVINPFNSHWMNNVAGDLAGNFLLAASYGTAMLVFLAIFHKRLVEYIDQPLQLRELVAAPRRELIDELERKNKSLVLSDQKFRNLAESIDDVFFSMDENMRCTYWNQAAERTGYKAVDMVGADVFKIFPGSEYFSWKKFYEEVLESGKPGQAEFFVQGEEHDRNFEVSAYPFAAGLSVLVKDVTSRKEMEAQLLQSQRMESIGRLAGSIAHDFNNLLVPITANAELGMMRMATDNKDPVYLKRIIEAAEQAAGLTRQILAFSRKQVLEMQVLDLNTVVMEYGTMIQRLIGEDIKIKTNLASDLALVEADRGQIEQVLLNLVVNAKDAMPMGGTLTIETANVILDKPYAEQKGEKQPAGRYSMLVVRDTGHGMNRDTQKDIFEPFFTTKTKGKGTGLGLATVYGIVKQHKGSVRVDSEPGVGSTFKLYLQHASDSSHVPAKNVPASNLAAGTETILLVEDGTMVRNILREGLEAYGYAVLEAQDVADGLKLASENDNIDLLLTDVVMPDMNGRELYDKIVLLQPSISVLFISGYTDDVIVDQGILEEGVNFLQKPFSIASLVRKVRACLSQELP